ncbi:MAG: hypothetical protein JW969_16560 [Spirochaetales bacterium]|nr:hypothetical protein [Spirochaetales bacterium]
MANYKIKVNSRFVVVAGFIVFYSGYSKIKGNSNPAQITDEPDDDSPKND